MATIEVKNLSKSYFSNKKSPGVWMGIKNLFSPEIIEKKAVQEISFSVKQGEFIGFLGPNGAGKTTTLKMLSGIVQPTRGKIRVLGFDPWQHQNAYKRQFALLMGQKNQLWWDLPAMESFLLNQKIYEIEKGQFKKTLDELVALLGIGDNLNIPVRNLSLGERMKCELVSALLHSPKVLFLDEPTIGLDVVAQKNIRDFLLKYNREKNTTIILTSHYMEDIQKLCKRVVIINQKIFYDGLLSKLIDNYADSKIITVTFSQPVNKNDLVEFGKIIEFEGVRARLKVDRKEAKEVVKKLLSTNLPTDDFQIDEMGIDRVIRNIFQGVENKNQ
ncbi:MAG TPA: ATP-binding cassette domain-containing protein [Candidatus Moranbacteria bacterium]|nr:ATP-binding cassette domain-containing protein [Candidatus Moranbacteria bacterium]